MKSYLDDRIQLILIAGYKSADSQLDFGVHKVLFEVRRFIACILNHLERYTKGIVLNITNMQILNITFKLGYNMDEAFHAIEICLDDINRLMENNLLKLFSSKHSVNITGNFRLKIRFS